MFVVLDANVLIADPSRRKIAFQTLSRLANEEIIRIFVPQISENEFFKNRRALLNKSQDCIIQGLKGYGKFLRDPVADQEIKRIEYEASILDKKIFDGEETEYRRWKILNNILTIPADYAAAGEVFSDYFSGRPPFTFIGDKANLTDAFIISSILKFFKEDLNNVFIVSNDANFRDTISSRCECFASLDDLIKSNAFNNLIAINPANFELESVELIQKQLKWHVAIIERECDIRVLEDYTTGCMDDTHYDIDNISLNMTNQNGIYHGNGIFSLTFYGEVVAVQSIGFLEDYDDEEVEEYLENGFKIVDEQEHYIIRKYENEKFSINVVIEFNFDDIRSGRIIKDGVFVSLFRAKITTEEIKLIGRSTF